MPVRIRVTVHHDRVVSYLRSPTSEPARFVGRRAQLTAGYAKTACPVDEGHLRNSIQVTPPAPAGTRTVAAVFSPLHYAVFVHEGTGLYGPRRAWIYPRKGRFMVFQVKRPFGPMPKGKRRPAVGRRPVVFARRVRGQAPSPFLRHGLEMAMPGATFHTGR